MIMYMNNMLMTSFDTSRRDVYMNLQISYQLMLLFFQIDVLHWYKYKFIKHSV